MDPILLLDVVLAKTGDIIAAVPNDAVDAATPCPAYDVRALMNHIVGWVQVFEAGCNNRQYEGDASAYECGTDPAQEFRTAADGLVAGWREHGIDRGVRISSGDSMPGEMVLNMTVMEYLTHGWDLAVATQQPVPFTADEATEGLIRAKATLPPEYQGEGMPFGAPVKVAEDASAMDRFVAFLGRRPDWSA